MNRHRLWIWAVLTATAAAVGSVQLGRFRSAGPFNTADRDDGPAAINPNPPDAPPPVYEFALFAEDTRAFCRTNRNHIEIRDVATNETLATLDFQEKLPVAISATPTGDALLASYLDGSLVLWSVGPEGNRYRPRILGQEPAAACCDLSRDGRLAVTGHEDGTVILRDARTGGRLYRIQAQSRCVCCVRFSRDGTRLLTARRTIGLWNVRTGKRMAMVPARGSVIGSAELSADGRRVLAADRNWGSVTLWNAETASVAWNAEVGKRSITAMAWSPDQQTVAIGDTVGEVWLRWAKSGRRIAMLPETTSIVSCLRFSADGARLYVSRQDGLIRTWEVQKYSGH